MINLTSPLLYNITYSQVLEIRISLETDFCHQTGPSRPHLLTPKPPNTWEHCLAQFCAQFWFGIDPQIGYSFKRNIVPLPLSEDIDIDNSNESNVMEVILC